MWYDNFILLLVQPVSGSTWINVHVSVIHHQLLQPRTNL